MVSALQWRVPYKRVFVIDVMVVLTSEDPTVLWTLETKQNTYNTVFI